MLAIELEGICKVYKKSWIGAAATALDNVSLALPQGESFGFIGPNGAGKTTTIKILTGGVAPTAGSARLYGVPVGEHRARVGLGFVPENPSLPDYMTPMEILAMGLRVHGLKLDNERAHCIAWLERFELARVANKVIRGFSKGMVQRTALAHALAVKPRLLILDEPLSGLDPLGRRDVVEILAEFKRAGGTLFFTSHVLHDVERLADRFGLIHQGKISAVRSPAELSGDEEKVVVRTLGSGPLDRANEELPGRWLAEIPRRELWDFLDRVRAAGHVLVEVRPSLSLESAFMKVVGRT